MDGRDKELHEGGESVFAASKEMNDLAMEDEPKGPVTFRDRGRRFMDSFRRDPSTYIDKSEDGDIERSAAAATAASPLKRKLKARHLQMIAIGGSVGKTGR